jgi:NAD(P)-dependent dehydrogenase (short-subunit alcohol dehydrogenase family)
MAHVPRQPSAHAPGPSVGSRSLRWVVASDRRVCLFTGVSGRLGQDFAARYADTYDIVGVYDTTVPSGPFRPLDAPARRAKGGILAVQADLGAVGAPEEVVRAVLARFGSVDLVVNAAVFRHYAPLHKKALVDSLDWQLYFNVVVPVRIVSALTRRAWSRTIGDNRARHRNVVNLSSVSASVVYAGQAGYGASKAALEAVTRHQASELAAIGVRANAVAPNSFPGIMATGAVSDAVVELDGGTVNGQVLFMDRGVRRWLPDPGRIPT